MTPASPGESFWLVVILLYKEGFRLSSAVAWPVGLCVAADLFCVYLVMLRRAIKNGSLPQGRENGS